MVKEPKYFQYLFLNFKNHEKNILGIIVFLSLYATAQKASVKEYDVEITFNQPDAFKNINTISYELQDNGEFWNHIATDENPTLTSIIAYC